MSVEYIGQIQFEIVEQTKEQVVAHMPIQAGILNPFGSVHAGATIWFADVVATHLALQGREFSAGMKGFPLAINLNANLVGNQAEGVFTATARFVKHGRRVSVVNTLVTGQDGRVIADVTTNHIAS